MREPAAIVEVWRGAWPLLQAALSLYGDEPRSAERLCKVIRNALRGAGKARLLCLTQPQLCKLCRDRCSWPSTLLSVTAHQMEL